MLTSIRISLTENPADKARALWPYTDTDRTPTDALKRQKSLQRKMLATIRINGRHCRVVVWVETVTRSVLD